MEPSSETTNHSVIATSVVDRNYVPALVFTCLLIVSTVVFNLFACFITLQSRTHQTVTNYFMVTLYITDVLVALVSMPVWAMFQVYWDKAQDRMGDIDLLWLFADILFGTATIGSLVCVTVDKWIAISRPLRYISLMTHQRMMICIAVTWMYGVIVASSRFLPWREVYRAGYSFLVLTASFVLPLSIIASTYYRIFIVARSQTRNCALQAPNGAPDNQRRIRRELKTVKTIAIIVGSFFVCWLPFFVSSVVYSYHLIDLKFANLKFMTYCNALMNPLVNTFSDRHLKTEVVRRLVKCCRRSP